MSQPETIAQAVRDRAGDTSTGLIAGDLRLTHAEVVSRAAQRAAWLRANRSPGPFHVAVLLEQPLQEPPQALIIFDDKDVHHPVVRPHSENRLRESATRAGRGPRPSAATGPCRGIVSSSMRRPLASNQREKRRSIVGDKTPKRPPKQKKPKAPKV